eukprot:405980-Pleurochrysis_carterae.AAC.2
MRQPLVVKATEWGGRVTVARSGTRAATIREQAQARGLPKRTCRGGSGQGCSAGGDPHARASIQSLESRARPSAPQARMRCERNLGNCARER